jgi:hypothetical protein
MCRKNVLTIVAVAILPLAIGQVQAVTVPIPIDNPGFEDPVLADGEYDYSLDNQGWGYFDNGGEQGSWNPGLPGTSEPGFGGNAPEGQNVGWVNPGGVGVPGGLAQVLTDADATLQADATYTLIVEVGNTPNYPWSGYKVQLLAGGTPHTPGTGGDTGPVTGGTLLAEDNNSLTIAEDTFETSTVTYTYDPELHSGLLGEPLQIRLLSLGNVAAGDWTEVNFDNVRLSYDGPPRPPLAKNPTPADGAQIDDAWVFLTWTAAAAAVEHDVYFGDDFDEVNDATSEPPVDPYKGRQTDTFYQDYDLVPGTTYYWRIDEVNDTEPNSPWKGRVWSFWIPPRTAYDPNPSDGVKFVNPDVTLSWTAGFKAKLHTVYFGDNFDDVNNAVVGLPQTETSYTPGTLELEKTYYWRIDEFDGTATYKGDVWSFSTIPDIVITDPSLVGWWKLDEDMGTTAVDWSGHGNHGTFEGDPQWVPGYDGAALEFDGDDYVDTGNTEDLANWTLTAWVISPEAPSSASPSGPVHREKNYQLVWNHNDETYRGGAAMRVGGTWHAASYQPLQANRWYHLAATYDGNVFNAYRDGVLITSNQAPSGPPDSESGTLKLGRHATSANNYFTGTVDNVRVYNKALTVEEIKLAMRGDSLLAWDPKPANGSAVYIRDATPLSWSPGDNASQHDVYFGTDKGTVADADASDTTGIYRGRQSVTIYTPAEGVEWGGGPYYWRVDEYNTDGTISKGNVWTFTITDFIEIDDFEDYNDYPPDEIFSAWEDGFGTTTNGALIAHDDPPFAETTVVHGGGQSMAYRYDNNFKYSEATMTLVSARDWTEKGVGVLSLWFRGNLANAAERMYVALNGIATVYHDNPDAALINTWTEWRIDLQEFAAQGVNLANVNTISIGFGDKNNLQAGGSGMVFFDDIRLYRPSPEPTP